MIDLKLSHLIIYKTKKKKNERKKKGLNARKKLGIFV